ncbi:MAG: tetratricopeptide repeat protein [Planctomycetes bacterium]|nr:tetratricopeptide repeat protein [Planctomycetota bacterium]
MSIAASFLGRLVAALLGSALAATANGQQPPAEPPPAIVRNLLTAGGGCLQAEDPIAALAAYRTARVLTPADPGSLTGLGQTHLMLGRPTLGLAYADAVLQQAAGDQPAMTLRVRALIRARRFDEAVQQAGRFLLATPQPGAELLAARASALFRVQRTDEAAAVYARVLELDPLHAEAHLRLGSGLTPPVRVVIGPEILQAIAAARAGRLATAEERLQGLLATEPGHPVAHRLLGETLFLRKLQAAMVAADPAFLALRQVLSPPDTSRLPIAELIPAYPDLSPARRQVVERALALFGTRLGKLVAVGARHDLLQEAERTTDEPARTGLRGKRTFDGRVWDDVRGIGGLRAATGIEALDDATWFGFDTLAHEITHQVHYYALPPVERARIRELYERARRENRFLDYYAATNEAEYFGQGVEAFAALGKRPACETTHGHTRFELLRVDPALHELIERLVDFDPLREGRQRSAILAAAIEVALRCGRVDDAIVAAGLLPTGATRERLLARAQQAAFAVQSR